MTPVFRIVHALLFELWEQMNPPDIVVGSWGSVGFRRLDFHEVGKPPATWFKEEDFSTSKVGGVNLDLLIFEPIEMVS